MLDHDNLEEFADAVNYDILDPSDTGVGFYAGLAQETGGPVLELACGTGRVSIPIARLGIAVTGLDIVPGMLAQARAKSAGLPVRWVEGDARSFRLGERFRLIFLTGNAFQAFLTRTDQAALLDRVAEHLAEGGLFAFETRNPQWRGLTAEPGRGFGPAGDPAADGSVAGREAFAYLETRPDEEPWGTYTDREGHTVQVSRTQVYDPIAQLLHWTSHHRWLEGDQLRTKVTRIAVRFTFPQELETLLHCNGFEVVRRYGDWNLEPLGPASPSMIVVCRRRNN